MLGLTLIVLIGMPVNAETAITATDWGKAANDKVVQLYTLKSGDIQVQITNYGARIVREPQHKSAGRVIVE